MYVYIVIRSKVYIHAVNKNGGAEAVAPVDVLGVHSSITLPCKLS